ncbi:MAG TPA: BrnT family toxin [Methylococcaceae bacterium]|nr:BrnT family toxin [Methylococcaceae bacterium]
MKRKIRKDTPQYSIARPDPVYVFNQPLLIGNDEKHSKIEKRYYALEQTDDGRRLFLVCTIRNKLIRVISARDMSIKERGTYQK